MTAGWSRQTSEAPVSTWTSTDIVDAQPDGPGSTMDAATDEIESDAPWPTQTVSPRSSPPIGPAAVPTQLSPAGVALKVSGGSHRSVVSRVAARLRSATRTARARCPLTARAAVVLIPS